MSSHVALTSGIATIGVGTYGYVTTKSIPSLAGGCALGVAFLSATYLIKNTDRQTLGHSVAAVAGTAALVLAVKRLQVPSNKVRLGPFTLLMVGVLNVPYQYMKAYEWASQN